MHAPAHLRLIVSDAPSEQEEAAQDRRSIVQPVSLLRLRLRWLTANGGVALLWFASALLLSMAALLLVSLG